MPSDCTANCIQYVKDTDFKANYNSLQRLLDSFFIVFNMSKIQISKQITTEMYADNIKVDCIQYVKDTDFKANYNESVLVCILLLLYSICQRYRFQSKLQLKGPLHPALRIVFNMSKIQISKQITTTSLSSRQDLRLYSICQRYRFQSKLQPRIRSGLLSQIVFNMSKIQISKQITTFISEGSSLDELYSICQRYRFQSKLQPGDFYA